MYGSTGDSKPWPGHPADPQVVKTQFQIEWGVVQTLISISYWNNHSSFLLSDLPNNGFIPKDTSSQNPSGKPHEQVRGVPTVHQGS